MPSSSSLRMPPDPAALRTALAAVAIVAAAVACSLPRAVRRERLLSAAAGAIHQEEPIIVALENMIRDDQAEILRLQARIREERGGGR